MSGSTSPTRPSPQQVRGHLVQWCAAGWTADRVRGTLVAEFGEQILAAPPKHGFWLLAWIVPIGVLGGGARWPAGWRWPGRGDVAARPLPSRPNPLDAALDARIDADLAGFE